MSRVTIGRPVSLEGMGLHLGEHCTLTFIPASAGQGILFRRTDVPDSAPIPALVDQVSASERRTKLGREPFSVHTVEHVLAAVAAHGIDDL
ncbi:MAG: UDP-3-O-acyl-N-acetylglucosamine deacetylase, partial [Gemmatimonadaceae bacterium]